MTKMRHLLGAVLAATLAASAFAQATPAEGEVRRVDKSAAKITLKHGEIRNLDMPPMTMVFAVRDKALLDKVKAGDKVVFTAAQDGGTYVLTSVELRKD